MLCCMKLKPKVCYSTAIISQGQEETTYCDPTHWMAVNMTRLIFLSLPKQHSEKCCWWWEGTHQYKDQPRLV